MKTRLLALSILFLLLVASPRSTLALHAAPPLAGPRAPLGPSSLYLPFIAGGSPISGSPTLGGCSMFPSDNPWNRGISGDPVDPNSANYIASVGTSINLHADFGGNDFQVMRRTDLVHALPRSIMNVR